MSARVKALVSRDWWCGLQGAGYEGLLSCVYSPIQTKLRAWTVQIKDLGAKAGVVLNPGTSLTTIEEVCFLRSSASSPQIRETALSRKLDWSCPTCTLSHIRQVSDTLGMSSMRI